MIPNTVAHTTAGPAGSAQLSINETSTLAPKPLTSVKISDTKPKSAYAFGASGAEGLRSATLRPH